MLVRGSLRGSRCTLTLPFRHAASAQFTAVDTGRCLPGRGMDSVWVSCFLQRSMMRLTYIRLNLAVQRIAILVILLGIGVGPHMR